MFSSISSAFVARLSSVQRDTIVISKESDAFGLWSALTQGINEVYQYGRSALGKKPMIARSRSIQLLARAMRRLACTPSYMTPTVSSTIRNTVSVEAIARKDSTVSTRPTGYNGPEPASTVEELKTIMFKKTKDRKQYFRELAQNEYWIERTAENLFSVLDSDKDGSLQLGEMKPLFDVLIRRAAKIVMGFSWGLGPIVKREAKKTFENKIMPTSSFEDGADLFNLKVLINGTLLFCSGESDQEECKIVATHHYAVRKIDYKILTPAQIPETITEVCDTICVAITSKASSEAGF